MFGYKNDIYDLRQFLHGMGWDAGDLSDEELLAICGEINILFDAAWRKRSRSARRGETVEQYASKDWYGALQSALAKLRIKTEASK